MARRRLRRFAGPFVKELASLRDAGGDVNGFAKILSWRAEQRSDGRDGASARSPRETSRREPATPSGRVELEPRHGARGRNFRRFRHRDSLHRRGRWGTGHEGASLETRRRKILTPVPCCFRPGASVVAFFRTGNADGSQTWVRVRNGVVDNAGVNSAPRSFDPNTGLNAPVKK